MHARRAREKSSWAGAEAAGFHRDPACGLCSRLRAAIEAICGVPLEIERVEGAWRVRLPPFHFMSLVVVTRA